MRTSLNILREILEEFDETWKAEGMESRSRVVREAMQEYTERHTRLEAIGGEAVATVAFDYEHTPSSSAIITRYNTTSKMSSTRCSTCITGSGVSKRSSVLDRRIGFVNWSIISVISTRSAV